MYRYVLIFFLLCQGTLYAQQKPDPDWVEQKYSMFIHWGLYSELGGVWQGQPVTRGYSEQIQSFAGIFSDWYASVADRFNPLQWDADAVVALAKAAGMKSIVFTSKHHDGFCMYHSQYTDYNIVDATPFGRDVMRELADACGRHGVKFAVYYSLIDWHFPEAYPISSHNADPVTPVHHSYSMKQVEEIMTHYGPISEIWFDMGSLRAEQSKELYDLVARLQPQCMVSGRLGNDRGDFSVMADNTYPDYKIGVPWQTPASFFDETWSYRSWQERGDINLKIEEKIRGLVKVVSRGGNYLLNIGPRGDGSVVEYERDALLAIGEWLKSYGEAIYATKATPFEYAQEWGEITCKEDKIYLFVREMPDNREIVLRGVVGAPLTARLLSGGEQLGLQYRDHIIRVRIPETVQPERGYVVAELAFDGAYKVVPDRVVKGRVLTAGNSNPVYAYSSMDYYSRFRSTVGYSWHFNHTGKEVAPWVHYTPGDEGKKLRITIDGDSREVILTGGELVKAQVKPETLEWEKTYVYGPVAARFRAYPEDAPAFIDVTKDNRAWRTGSDLRADKQIRVFPVKEKQTVCCLHEIQSSRDQALLVEIGIADAMQVVLNGEVLLQRTYVGGNPKENEIIMLPLKKGMNQLFVELHNRYGDEIEYVFNTCTEQQTRKLRLEPFRLQPGRLHDCRLEPAHPENKNSDIGLRDIQILF